MLHTHVILLVLLYDANGWCADIAGGMSSKLGWLKEPTWAQRPSQLPGVIRATPPGVKRPLMTNPHGQQATESMDEGAVLHVQRYVHVFPPKKRNSYYSTVSIKVPFWCMSGQMGAWG